MPQILSSFAKSSPTDGWVESFAYIPDDRAVELEKGRLFAFVSLPQASEKRTLLSNTVFNHIQEDYYATNSTETLNNLKTAFANAYTILGEGELFVAVFFETKMIAVVQGESEIILFRGGTQITLLRAVKEEEKAVSGYIKPGDVFVCGTHAFFDHINGSALSSTVSSRNPEECTDFLMPLIEVHKDGQIGAWIFKVQETLRTTPSAIVPVPFHKQNTIDRDMAETDDVDQAEVATEIESTTPIAPSTPNQLPLSKWPLYVKPRTPLSFAPRRKTPLILGGVFVLLLVLSIVFGKAQLEERQKEEIFQGKISAIEQKLEEAKTLANINPQKARELFATAKKETSALEKDEKHLETIIALEKKQDTLQKEILGEEHAELSLFVDLSLLSSGFSANSVVSDGSQMYIFDNENKRVSKVSLSSNRAEIIAGSGSLENVMSIAATGDTLYGLKENGIYKLPGEVRLIEDDFTDGILLSYAGNLYVVYKKESLIYRYSGGSGPRTNWLIEGIEPNFSDAISAIVDGTIWVLRENGELLRFSNGNPVVFSLYGAIPEIARPQSFYTDVDSETLYVLDSDNARIVLATKGGEFQRQYVSDELKEAKLIVASEKEGKIFIVTKDKVLVMDTGK